MNRPRSLKRAVLFCILSCAVATATAKSYPERAEEALQEYLAAFLKSKSPAELHKYWSKRYTREQQLSVSQLASLPENVREQVEGQVHRSMQNNVRDVKDFKVTCEATRCTARASLSGNVSHTYYLVREDGRILIDGAEIHLGTN